jgi:hypothetical protein
LARGVVIKPKKGTRKVCQTTDPDVLFFYFLDGRHSSDNFYGGKMKHMTNVSRSLGVLLYKTLPPAAEIKTRRSRWRNAVRKNSRLAWLDKIMEATGR